ncbi:hypothetical protein QTP88_014489 [Uroleucon formosanum]
MGFSLTVPSCVHKNNYYSISIRLYQYDTQRYRIILRFNVGSIGSKFQSSTWTKFSTLLSPQSGEVGRKISIYKLSTRQNHERNSDKIQFMDAIQMRIYAFIPYIDHFISQLNLRFTKHKNTFLIIQNFISNKLIQLSENEIETSMEVMSKQSSNFLIFILPPTVPKFKSKYATACRHRIAHIIFGFIVLVNRYNLISSVKTRAGVVFLTISKICTTPCRVGNQCHKYLCLRGVRSHIEPLSILFIIFLYLRSLAFRPATDPQRQLIRWRAATTSGPAAADGGGVGGDACAVAAARDVRAADWSARRK